MYGAKRGSAENYWGPNLEVWGEFWTNHDPRPGITWFPPHIGLATMLASLRHAATPGTPEDPFSSGERVREGGVVPSLAADQDPFLQGRRGNG